MDQREPVTPGDMTPSGAPSAEPRGGHGADQAPGAPGPSRHGGWYRSLGRRSRVAAMVAVAATATAVALSLVGSGSPSHSRARAAALVEAKNFTIPVLGKPSRHVSLSQYAGRPVIVNFFASWCTPCQKETPLIAKFYADAHGSIAVIGVDVNDTTASALAFVHAKGVTYPVGTDPLPSPTAVSYGVAALPQTFFLNARHQIVKRIFGAVTLHEMQAGAALIERPK